MKANKRNESLGCHLARGSCCSYKFLLMLSLVKKTDANETSKSSLLCLKIQFKWTLLILLCLLFICARTFCESDSRIKLNCDICDRFQRDYACFFSSGGWFVDSGFRSLCVIQWNINITKLVFSSFFRIIGIFIFAITIVWCRMKYLYLLHFWQNISRKSSLLLKDPK